MFVHPGDVAPTKGTKRKAATGESVHESRRPLRRQRMVGLEGSDSDAEPAMMQTPDEEDDQDKREVQRQNHILNAIGGGPIRFAELGAYAVDEMRSNTTATFRPTTIEKDIYDKIGHPDHQGPSRSALMKGEVPSVNMTVFSRKNCIQPATKDPSYENLKEALRNLRQFGGGFYNESTVDFIRAIERFVESFGLTSAMRIKDELSLHDPLLAELLYDEQKTMIATLKAQLAVIPYEQRAALLRQSGNASSENKRDTERCKCFSTKRDHFRPKTLPEPVKQHIIKNFGGLAPEFADL
ncbi:uncharacterized protein PITG_11030 [Phytophthora infestans T30-4]|uniref:Uncharacterized protein n=1 Tax=Phytophthora infestans (strain T30-4) TaxID=403677 RepID=D0NG08_PHYIT|nr:uncharacterized protein PITG_11030 [Phytophthora infestans T30-4]EEY57209.1 conserved hypothetical protein [Phytophthora infestans T30-4]|eukprot:XP_002901819.1 conserved hypothetical protein [Phytophthora infestans T30-4]